jgi:hypothetical protein
MSFLEIKRNFRSGKVESYKLVTREDILTTNPNNMDVRTWTSCARVGSRFSLTTKSQKFMYIRTDVIDEEMIKRLELDV